MRSVLTTALALMPFAGVCWLLALALYRVMGPWPDWMVKIYYWKWKGNVMGYFTVRYETDDDGLWQIVEETATGNRYRVHVRDAKGVMKW
jgi:hypothetical protein